MKTLNKPWILTILFIVFFNIAYFGYKNSNYLKAIFLNNQLDQVKENVLRLEQKVDAIQKFIDTIKEQEKPEVPSSERNRRRNRPN